MCSLQFLLGFEETDTLHLQEVIFKNYFEHFFLNLQHFFLKLFLDILVI